MPMSPYGPTNGVGGWNSSDVDWNSFYNNMGAGQNNGFGSTPYSNSGWGASRSYPTYVPGTANGSLIANKDQSRFPTDNPLQSQLLAYAGQQAGNPAAAAAATQANGTPYNNPGWGAGLLASLLGSGKALPPLPAAAQPVLKPKAGMPTQLPMPATRYKGTADARAAAQARDRLTMSRNGAFSPGYSGKQDGERWGQ